MLRGKNPGVRVHVYALALAAFPLVLNTVSAPGVPQVLPDRPTTIALQSGDEAVAPASTTGEVQHRSSAQRVGVPGTGGRSSSVTVTSPKGERTVTESRVGAHDIPWVALRAYKRSARILAEVDPTCQVPWTLLAAIGRVESDHGRYAGATLGTDGMSSPLVIGLPLNGAGPVARVRDTDNGRFDRDKVWDRAVGPMQFLPTTWAAAGVDADADGVRSPNDIGDAALAAAVYVCAGTSGVQASAPMRDALHRYNNSASYVSLVMAYERSYRADGISVSGSPVWTRTATVRLHATAENEVARAGRAVAKHAGRGQGSTTEKARKQPLPPHDTAGAVREDERPNSSDPSSESRTPGSKPAVEPAGAPDKTKPGPAPKPAPKPEPEPEPEPEPKPKPSPEPRPEPEPAPALVVAEGVWEACDEAFCLDGQLLDLGVAELQVNPAAADFDEDGVVETNAEEFAGLEGTTLTLAVEQLETGLKVYSISDYAYLLEDGTPAVTP